MPHLTTDDKVKLYYEETGTGTPVVFVHEFAGDVRSWEPQLRELGRTYRCIAYNARGYPPSDVPGEVQFYSQERARDDIRAVLDALKIDKAHVVGHSMGGWILTLLCYESPNRVRKAVNVAGGGTAIRPLQNMVEFKVPAPDQIRQHYARLAAASGGVLEVEDLAAPYIAKRDLPGHAEGFAKVMRHMTNPLTRQRYNTLRRLPFITVPTLVVWGREDPVNSLEEVGMPTANGIPGAKLIVYDNTGHSVPWEQPERFSRDVLAFLTS